MKKKSKLEIDKENSIKAQMAEQEVRASKQIKEMKSKKGGVVLIFD